MLLVALCVMFVAAHAALGVPTDIAKSASPTDTIAEGQQPLLSLNKHDITTIGLSTTTVYSTNKNYTSILVADPASSITASTVRITTTTRSSVNIQSRNGTMTMTDSSATTQPLAEGTPSNAWSILWPTNGTGLSVSMTPTAALGLDSGTQTAFNVLSSSKNLAPREKASMQIGAVGIMLMLIFQP